MITQNHTVKRGRRVVRALTAWVSSAAVSFAPSIAGAQGGEDHGDEKPTAAQTSGPRVVRWLWIQSRLKITEKLLAGMASMCGAENP